MIASGIFDPREVKCMKEDCLRGKARIARIVAVSALFMAAVMILTPTVLATNHPYLVGLGQTLVDNRLLDATVSDGMPPLQIDVTNGDSVTIFYNYGYSDNRTSPPYSNKATHTFNLSVYYNGLSLDGNQHITYPDYGYQEGSLSVIVNNVSPYTYIWVNYSASILCSDISPYYDSATHGESIYLY